MKQKTKKEKTGNTFSMDNQSGTDKTKYRRNDTLWKGTLENRK